MANPDPVKEQILNQADIVDIVSQYITLQKRGGRHFGLCPFHKEKTPSFSVDDTRQYYHCFGCGQGGNVIDFIMAVENLTFWEARAFLAERLGIRIEKQSRRKQEHSEIDRFQVMDSAAQLFRKWLYQTESAKDYVKSRGLEKEHVERFGIGLAPDAWDSLLNALHERKIPEKVQQELGLIVPRQTGNGYYDRFRNRIMFPIRNTLGRVIAFGGRALDPNDNAKYLNSNDTPIFNKSKVLYLLDQAKNVIKDRGAVVVEGYMDAIALHIHGFEEAVATLGTSLTPDHIQILKRYTNRFTLLYDSDTAGVNAAMRGVELFFDAGLPVRVLSLPEGKDPDDFLKVQGAEQLRELLDNAPDGFRFCLENRLNELNLVTPEGKAQAVKAMMPLLARIREAFLRHEYLGIMAAKIGTDLTSLQQSVAQSLKSKEYKQYRNEEPANHSKPQKKTLAVVPSLKRNLIALLSCHLGLMVPDELSPHERPKLFTSEDLSDTLSSRLQMLDDGQIESRLLQTLLELDASEINPSPSEWERIFPDKADLNAYIAILQSEPLPANAKALLKMRDEIVEGIRLEVERKTREDAMKTGNDRELLQKMNEMIFAKK